MNTYNFYPEKLIGGKSKGDTGFIVSTILLWGIGIFALYICSQTSIITLLNSDKMYFVKRQLLASLFGFAGLVFFAFCPFPVMKKILPAFCIASALLCLLTFVPGIKFEENHASRWIKIGSLTFQPSELMKLSLILFLANFFENYESKKESDDATVSPAVIVLSGVIALIFAQRDYSTGVLVFVTGFIMFVLSGSKLSWLVPFTVFGIPTLILVALIEPYRVDRITSYLDPSADPTGRGFQSLASKRAITSGGFWGQGIGLDDINRVPEIQSDYIFSGWSYAMGFIGVLAFFALLILFLYRAVKIAMTCTSRFGALGTFGCAGLIFVQAVMNCAVVAGVVPATGIPLPFFSSGGSSLIVTLCMCGFIINASYYDEENPSLIKNVKLKKDVSQFEECDVDMFK